MLKSFDLARIKSVHRLAPAENNILLVFGVVGVESHVLKKRTKAAL